MSKRKIALIFASVAVIGGMTVGIAFCSRNKASAPQEEVLVETDAPPSTEAEAETVPETEAPTDPPPELTDRAKELLAQNPDTVGWIYIEHTNVDNPFVQCGDNAYYLDHSFEGEYFRAGTVFMDFRDVFSYDENAQSENIILYGHNMANNTMFGSLRRYRQDPSYYQKAPIIHLESNYASYEYVIFGLVITDGSGAAAWRYWDMEDLSDKTQFNAYVKTTRRKSMAEIPVDVKYGDKLLTLSTCYSDADDSRFLVIARRIREDESAEYWIEKFSGEAE